MKRRRIDAASKLLFIGPVVAELIRARTLTLAAELRLDRIEPLPAAFVADDRSQRFGDAAFRVPYRRGRFPPPQGRRRGERRFLIATVEFQSRGDRHMLGRVRDYAPRMDAHYRHQGVLSEGQYPPLLAFVVHTGPAPWRDADGTEVFAGLSANAVRELAPYQRQAYIAVDVGPGAAPDWPADGRLAAAARLAGCVTASELAGQLLAEWNRFGDPVDATFRRGMLAWTEEALLGFPESGIELPSFDELEGLEETEMAYLLEKHVRRWQADWRAEGRLEGVVAGRLEGREEGVVAGQRDLLLRQTERRFGTPAAQRLNDALKGVHDARQLAELGDLVVACATAEEFVGRVASLRGRTSCS